MAAGKKMVDEITARSDDFAKWYTDIVRKADLIDYSSVKGSMIIRPYGYAIWENIQSTLDKMFKDTGHENIYMPLFIPESLLNKEKDHVEGFAPEVAWVTHGGSEKLSERLCVRPTSETLFCEHYAKIIESYRDLPKLYNQWCNVVRWEKETRPFLRSREFLWQEGHTVHETEEEAWQETERMLDVYADFCQDVLAIPVIKGRKTEKEKFAGAVATYTIEAMMHDGKALQSATSHYFGDDFAKAFDITYTGRDNKLAHPFQTSWGCTTRLIGAIIMTHGDDNGLMLPPKIAPTQVMIIPIAQHKEGVIDKASEVFDQLKDKFRVKIDTTDNSPGWKFAECEMKGIPLRLEIGPKDIAKNQCVLVRRDTREKFFVAMDELDGNIEKILAQMQEDLYSSALANREEHTYTSVELDDIIKIAETKPGFIKAMWCGNVDCEEELKEKAGLSSRCMPFEQEKISDKCVCCGSDADKMVVWGKSY